MKTFKNAKFKWTFRDYQQRVLDNSKKYLKDKKINIVAAPGSGKTILGLELIVRLNSPCIILSPTITIRDQWADRFKEAFLSEDDNINDYFSSDLNNIKLLNSITYQALHSAINNVVSVDDEEEVDYRNIDLFKLVNENKITTICLDEAHHLQNEWQKALEKFIKGLGRNITIVSLTATPPYDASEEEWNRYIGVCGEIDEEIFVPELVKQNTLCPHQDYVYFNYPSEEEIDDFKEYRNKAYLAIDEVIKTESFVRLYRLNNSKYNFSYGKIYKDVKGFEALLSLFDYASLDVDKSIAKKMFGTKEVEKFDLVKGEEAVRYILNCEDLDELEKEEILNVFKKYSLVERGKVKLDLNEKLKKKLVSSTGKLVSIENIVKSEFQSLKSNLRMLVLTDYIKKESVVEIGKDTKFNNISIVSIFETIRRSNIGVKIGALSGSLVILPLCLEQTLVKEFNLDKKLFSLKQINDTEYGSFTLKGTNKEKVSLLSELFKKGYIEVLVGTKSLLGEGWDSPCINSLILASFVGSYMLSNQMRGRAIRIYKDDPNKVSNIWHLVTIEPSYIFDNNKEIDNEKTIVSHDYETLKRRFTAFVGPNYEKRVVESGIERLTCIKEPFNKEGISNINKSMLALALNREDMKNIWLEALGGDGKLVLVNVIDKRLRVPLFLPILELGKAILPHALYLMFFNYLTNSFGNWFKGIGMVLSLIIFLALIPFTVKGLYIFFNHVTSKFSIKSLSKVVLNSLKQIRLINDNAKLNIVLNQEDEYEVSLLHASFEEERTFNEALGEFLSLNEDPRYLMIRKNVFKKRDFKVSYSVPSCFASSKKDVAVFKHFLTWSMGNFEALYTRSVNGKANIANYINASYVVRGKKVISKHKVI